MATPAKGTNIGCIPGAAVFLSGLWIVTGSLSAGGISMLHMLKSGWSLELAYAWSLLDLFPLIGPLNAARFMAAETGNSYLYEAGNLAGGWMMILLVSMWLTRRSK